MLDSQQPHSLEAPALWALPPGQALSLQPASVARQVVACRGRVWLTLDGGPAAAAQDHWLRPGEAFTVPAGQRAVLEGWPAASVQVLLPPPAAASGGAKAQSPVASKSTQAKSAGVRPPLGAWA
ncbi:DUF2917 domain-containing protein [Roseateles paludis]|uniref:DUF2917 domain-containing protein n=1 Tax=Roseateles paludis TaxID=3145238 RepID=A0ABV0FZB5_9BURK